jgi:hypothetical protein
MKEIKYKILCCVCESFCDSIYYGSSYESGSYSGSVITVPAPLRSVIKLRFRFRYGKSYASYGLGSGSATLVGRQGALNRVGAGTCLLSLPSVFCSMLEMTRQELRLAPTTFWDENKPMKRRQKSTSSVNN